ASIALGMLFGVAALYVAVAGDGIRSTLVSAVFLTLAIVSHHFTAMGAVEVVPDPTIAIAALSLSPPALSMTIASAAAAVIGISLVAALAGSSRQQLVASSEAEIASQAVRLQAALTNMSQGLCMLDLDRFKEVNDTLGHSVGDALLKAVTERLRACVRETDTIARLGGDEFAIVQRVTEPAIETASLAKRIQEAIAAPFDIDDHHVA